MDILAHLDGRLREAYAGGGEEAQARARNARNALTRYAEGSISKTRARAVLAKNCGDKECRAWDGTVQLA